MQQQMLKLNTDVKVLTAQLNGHSNLKQVNGRKVSFSLVTKTSCNVVYSNFLMMLLEWLACQFLS